MTGLCLFPDCDVTVWVPPPPREPLCSEHSAVLARRILGTAGEERAAALAQYRRRVMGLE